MDIVINLYIIDYIPGRRFTITCQCYIGKLTYGAKTLPAESTKVQNTPKALTEVLIDTQPTGSVGNICLSSHTCAAFVRRRTAKTAKAPLQ